MVDVAKGYDYFEIMRADCYYMSEFQRFPSQTDGWKSHTYILMSNDNASKQAGIKKFELKLVLALLRFP